MQKTLERILERLGPSAETTGSPIRLTELGRRISKDIGALDLVDQLASTVQGRLKGMEEYDIQEFCLRYAVSEYEPPPDTERRIKKAAFDNGLERRAVLRVIGIELRDELLRRFHRKD